MKTFSIMTSAAGNIAHGDIVKYDGDTWRVLAVGAQREGEIYLHLASTTRFIEQRNGKRPIQMASFVWPENLTKVMQ